MEALLASETDLAGFREEARALLAHQVPPEAVHWQTAHAENSDQFADPVAASDNRGRGIPKAASAIVPASFLRLCEVVVLHNDRSASTCCTGCCGGWCMSLACATTRSIPTCSTPTRWVRRCVATCTR